MLLWYNIAQVWSFSRCRPSPIWVSIELYSPARFLFLPRVFHLGPLIIYFLRTKSCQHFQNCIHTIIISLTLTFLFPWLPYQGLLASLFHPEKVEIKWYYRQHILTYMSGLNSSVLLVLIVSFLATYLSVKLKSIWIRTAPCFSHVSVTNGLVSVLRTRIWTIASEYDEFYEPH